MPNLEKDCRMLITTWEDREIPLEVANQISTQIWKWIVELEQYPLEEGNNI
jgi:hypothetical protein